MMKPTTPAMYYTSDVRARGIACWLESTKKTGDSIYSYGVFGNLPAYAQRVNTHSDGKCTIELSAARYAFPVRGRRRKAEKTSQHF
jgi:hypothetical protein